jgi:hypothetical protein
MRHSVIIRRTETFAEALANTLRDADHPTKSKGYIVSSHSFALSTCKPTNSLHNVAHYENSNRS